MPTYDATARFMREWMALTPEQRLRFRTARKKWIEDLQTG